MLSWRRLRELGDDRSSAQCRRPLTADWTSSLPVATVGRTSGMWWRHLARLSGRAPPCRSVWRGVAGSAALAADAGDGARRLPRSVASRYRGLRERPRVIRDVHEEEQLAEQGGLAVDEAPLWDPLDAWSTERGRTGVFDVHELVAVLDEEGLRDICVLRLPEEHAYVSHMVLATARSHQQMLTTAQFLRKLYKRKRTSSDPVPRIEGKDSRHWIAMDFVNIALHLFDRDTRALYDVDMLWAVGPQYDEMSQEAEELTQAVDPLADFSPWEMPDTRDPSDKSAKN